MSKRDPLLGIPVEACSLFLDLFRFFGTIILALIELYDADGRPMKADDIAFFFDASRKEVDRNLKRLMKAAAPTISIKFSKALNRPNFLLSRIPACHQSKDSEVAWSGNPAVPTRPRGGGGQKIVQFCTWGWN